MIGCVAVNDAFVMSAWGKTVAASDKVMMLADGSALFTKVLTPLPPLMQGRIHSVRIGIRTSRVLPQGGRRWRLNEPHRPISCGVHVADDSRSGGVGWAWRNGRVSSPIRPIRFEQITFRAQVP